MPQKDVSDRQRERKTPNKWICFRRERDSQLRSKQLFPGETHNGALSKLWHALDVAEKKHWSDVAAEIKKSRLTKYPGAAPRSKQTKEAVKKRKKTQYGNRVTGISIPPSSSSGDSKLPGTFSQFLLTSRYVAGPQICNTVTVNAINLFSALR